MKCFRFFKCNFFVLLFIAPSLMQAQNLKVTNIECQVTGSVKLMGDTDRVSEIVYVRVFDSSPPRILVKGNNFNFVVVGANVTNASGYTADGVDRSTEDVWDMAGKDAGPDGWQFNSEVRINRVTGSITMRSISTSPKGIRSTSEASGSCSPMKEGQRKF